jgi:RHS repeat-associated protein
VALSNVQVEKHIYGSSRLGILTKPVKVLASEYVPYTMSSVVHEIGNRNYELNNHLGNVLSVISDKVIPIDEGGTTTFLADIRQSTDYSPFGVTLENRNLKLNDSVSGNPVKRLRYAFNGMEKDDELKGSGNSYDFGARMLDPRVGRWLSIDPLSADYPSNSPYCFALNMPIFANDPDGMDVEPKTTFKNSTFYEPYLKLINNNSVYRKILSQYLPKGSSFDFILHADDKKVRVNARATTYTGGKTINGKFAEVLSNSYYTDDRYSYGDRVFYNVQGHIIKEYWEETEIAKAKTLLHEAIHAMIYPSGKEDDGSHNLFSQHQKLLFEGLVEYNKDNNLGYSEEDLEALSWQGIHQSEAFKNYIQNRATKSGKTYEQEYNSWSEQVHYIQHDVFDSEDLTEKKEEKSGVWDRGGELAPPEN